MFSLCVKRERERALYKREKSFGVGLVLSGCFVHRQQSVKMFCLSSGTPCLVCVCVRERERELHTRERKALVDKEREVRFCVGLVISVFQCHAATCLESLCICKKIVSCSCISCG